MVRDAVLILAALPVLFAMAVALPHLTTGSDSTVQQQMPDLDAPEYGREHIFRPVDGDVDALLKRNISVMADGWGRTPVLVRTNSHGLRDEAIALEKPEDTTRILVIGDSYTFGTGVNASQRYTDILERRLNRAFDQRVQVINAGVPGWGMENYHAFLEQYGTAFDPDVVVIAFIMNDGISREQQQVVWNKVGHKLSSGQSNRSPGDQYARSIQRFVAAKKDLYGGRPVNATGFRYIEDIGSLADREGIADVYFAVDVFRSEAAYRYVSGWAERTNKPLIHPPSAFVTSARQRFEKGIREPDPYRISPFIGDPSAAGHELLADTLYTQARAFLLPPHRRGNGSAPSTYEPPERVYLHLND